MGEVERGEAAPRFKVDYWCANGHLTSPSFAQAQGVEVPETWNCPRCGMPAGLDQDNPPTDTGNQPFKTHLAYVKERRSEAEGAALLDEALAALRNRGRRGPAAS